MEQLYMKYAFRVRWSKEDGEYLATVAEFPSLSWLDENQAEAFSGIVNLVKEVVEDMQEAGEQIPEPLSERNYSGNVRLRIPPEQHRELAIRAAEEGVSLNRLLCSLISRPLAVRAMGSDSQQERNLLEEANVVTGIMKKGKPTLQDYEPPRLVYSGDTETNLISSTEPYELSPAYDAWDEEM